MERYFLDEMERNGARMLYVRVKRSPEPPAPMAFKLRINKHGVGMAHIAWTSTRHSSSSPFK